MLAAVRHGEHPVVLIWALDRLSRHGSEDMQRYLRLLAEAGADVRSRQDPVAEHGGPVRPGDPGRSHGHAGPV